MKVKTLTLHKIDYPERLANIATPPKKLYVLGNTSLLNEPYTLSVVGSRKVTPYGSNITSKLVESTASHGIVIISGLALGVDAIAHQSALNVNGKTIAVMPSGLDTIYPASHRNLALRILEHGGLLVSEYNNGMPALKQNFVARNRIVSGLGDGVLITEAGRQSGTIHTANFALDQGKTVMAVPGNITSTQSEGTNNLIRTGAIPVMSAEDIYHALGLETEEIKQEIFTSNPDEAAVISLIQKGITDGAELLVATGMDSRSFNQTMSMLEITGKIRPLGAGHWVI